ncbi:MAG TPA: ROK family protein [Acidimicrobiia bacterium]|jgi:predicted NBD/HSP70 family sugar kinase
MTDRPAPQLYGGIDIGGTNIDCAVVSPDGTIEGRATQPTAPAGGRALVDAALACLAKALTDAGRSQGDLLAVGVGVPGRVDSSDGWVRTAVNLHIDDGGIPLGRDLAHALAVPVTVENDARMAAVGATIHYGDGTPVRDLAYIGLGTGVAAGIVRGGRLVRGSHAMAGEIGHVPVIGNPTPCACGLVGCLETLVSGPAIARAWPQAATEPARHVFAAAGDGDAAAVAVADDIARTVANAVQWLAAACDPNLIVVGGGVAVAAGRGLADRVLGMLGSPSGDSTLGRQLYDPDHVRFVPPDVLLGAVGAAALAQRRFGRTPSDRAEQQEKTGGGT